MNGLTPVQRRIITALGAKQIHGEQFSEKPQLILTWVTEALELLLLREIERAAVEDNIDIGDGLIEMVQSEGAAAMRAAARKTNSARS